MKSDGGSAFPEAAFVLPDGEVQWGQEGMSLRDWFAGRALEGLLGARKDLGWGHPKDIAKRCFEFADAMLDERILR